jgi:3-oxoacyl-[acyl-carrier protein] reductase
MMNTGLDGKFALVTGGSRGIGEGVALSLASAGCHVLINYEKSADRAMDLVERIKGMGRRAFAVKADVSSEKEVQAMKEMAQDRFGHIDVLVNNAGIHQHLKFWELGLEDWNRVIAVNLTGPFLCTKAFVEPMKKRQWGRIVNISSIIGLIGTDHEVHYAASKAGLLGLTKAMALELADYNITVNAIAPGWIDTDMTRDMTQEEKDEAMKHIPLKSVGTAEDIANAVVYLCSKSADYLTGTTLHVNGGWGMF